MTSMAAVVEIRIERKPAMTSRFVVTLTIFALAAAQPAFAANGKKLPQKSAPVQQTAKPSEEQSAPLNILSIIPAQGEPGMSVTLNGTGFTDKTTAFLGSSGVPTRVLDPKLLSFDIPELPPGLYALFLKREDGVASKAYNFTLLAQKPVAVALSPDTVYNCSAGKAREVVVSGRNFQEGALLLLDGAVIRSRYLSREAIAFTVPPQIPGGLHQVQVKNPTDAVSGAVALFINNKPEIRSVSQGEDFVNYYELIIEGQNFLQGSTLVVDGARLNSGTGPVGERERIIYIDCNRLIYQRHPYDSTQKSFRVQVTNPNGEESPVVTVNAP